jgi:type II secretory pathway pseudopilin PulG
MKRSGLSTVFGLPTLLTVLIVLSVLGFASLSVMTTAAQHRGMERSLHLMEATSEILAQTQTQQSALRASLSAALSALDAGDDPTGVITAWAIANNVIYDTSASTLTFTVSSATLRVTTVWWINPLYTDSPLRVLAQTLHIINDQDYTQDGDPIWKGPQ